MICAASTGIAWTCLDPWFMGQMTTMEENRPWWGVRTSNPGEAASLSQVGSTPTLFRHLQIRSASMTPACITDFDDWLVETFARVGSFTMLIMLVEIGETTVSP